MKAKDFETLTKPILAYKRPNGSYLIKEVTDKLYQGENVSIPLVIDTEFWQPNYQDYLSDENKLKVTLHGKDKSLVIKDFWSKGRLGVTTQIKGIHEKEGVILAHSDLVDIAQQLGEKIRHPIAKSGFHPIDYLNQTGIKTTLHRSDTIIKEFKGEVIPTCEFVLYAHFALAEWLMIANGEYRNDLERIANSNKVTRLEMRRRLRTVTEGKYGQSDSVEVPWRVRINGLMYRVKITLIDTCALHGIASYKQICETAGIALQDKNKMDAYKTRMHLAYFELPEDFDAYSLGDLEVYQALSNNSEQFKQIWRSLDIEEYYQPPKLTIGATVRDIFESKIYKLFKIKSDDKEAKKELLERVCRQGTAEYLKYLINSTQCLNAKVEGGRCRNNQPTLTVLEDAIADIDISGCYGEGQRNQLYPFGRPITDEFDYPSKINKYPSLREWLKSRKWGRKDCELVPGLWQARVCTKESWEGDKAVYALLKTPQDYLASWFDFKLPEISEMLTDTDIGDSPEEDFLEVKTGSTKIFNYQVVNGIITHDFVDWLYNVCNPSQRNEMLDGLFIHTAMYYPSYDRVDSPEELLERIGEHEGTNTTKSGKRKGGSRKTKITEECTAWYGVNLGEFIIDDLLAWRKIHPKKNADGTGNPLNTLYKLCINTLYGDMVSPYFKISNVVVGNNITARARAACYYTEKGLHGTLSITDGTSFNLNKVVYPSTNRNVTSQAVVNLYREKDPKRRNLKLAPLGNYDNIKLTWKKISTDKAIFLPRLDLYKNGEVTTIEPCQNNKGEWQNTAHDWLNQKAMEHLQSLFNVDVLQAETTKLKVINNNGIPVKHHIPRKGQFEYEVKSFYDRGFFHGSANYYLQGEGSNNLAMRSYEKNNNHEAVYWNEDADEIYLTKYHDNQTPAEYFMSQLANPYKVNRSVVFIKQGILKLNDAKKNLTRWQNVGRVCGDSIQKSGLLREFSLSQFTFQSMEQLKNIEREMNTNKRKYSQSYEGYFINEDGTLNFQEMINEIDKAISENIQSFNRLFDKSRNRHRNQDMYHPQKDVLDRVRESLLKPDSNKVLKDFFEDDSTILSDEAGAVYTEDDYEYYVSGEVLEDASVLDDFDFTL